MAISPTQAPPVEDPIQQAIDAWKAEQKQQQNDYDYLFATLKHMADLCKAGKIEEAFSVAEQSVMPSVMAVQGDAMGGLAASMNISSAIQKYVTQMQDDLNQCAKGINVDAAQDFTQKLKAIYDYAKTQADLPPGQGWMDPSTASSLMSSMTKTVQEFDTSATPDALPPMFDYAVAADMLYWNGYPTDMSQGDFDWAASKTGQQHIQNIQASGTQTNNSISAQSQSLTAEEQFASNIYNQYMNSCKDMFQSTQSFLNTIAQNLGKQ